MEFYHLYAWWFQFHHSPNKTGMAYPTQYFWNLWNPLNISCRWCLPIGLECSPQLLYWNLLALVWSFHSGLWFFPTNLFSWISHGWLDREVMVFLFCPITLFLYPKMTFERRILWVWIYRFLLVLRNSDLFSLIHMNDNTMYWKFLHKKFLHQ